jgi:hypothetical protein
MPAHLTSGRIIWADVPDSAGRNPKRRPIVVLQHLVRPAKEIEVVGVAVTGTLPKPLPQDYVTLPWQRDRRVRTLLDKPAAAVCSWVVRLKFADEGQLTMGGFVDGRLLETIVAKVNELASPRGGEAGPQGAGTEG